MADCNVCREPIRQDDLEVRLHHNDDGLVELFEQVHRTCVSSDEPNLLVNPYETRWVAPSEPEADD